MDSGILSLRFRVGQWRLTAYWTKEMERQLMAVGLANASRNTAIDHRRTLSTVVGPGPWSQGTSSLHLCC